MCVWFSLSESPSVPLDITVTHISDTSFSLTWLPPANTGRSDMEIDYYKSIIKSDHHTEFNCFSYQCNITKHSTMITNLKHGVKYNISISAINCVGLRESSDTLQLVTGTQNSLPSSSSPEPFPASLQGRLPGSSSSSVSCLGCHQVLSSGFSYPP